MKLTLTLTDQRPQPQNGWAQSRPVEYEDYERANLDGTGNARFIAQVLRGLADEIDPRPEPMPEWERDLLRGES